MDQLLQWFGAETYRGRLERIRRFWAGSERYLVTLNTQEHGYRQLFDPAAIRARAPLNLQAQARLPGVNMPAFFADFGTISTAKYWGGTPRFDSTGGHLFIDKVAESLDEAMAIDPLPVDHPDMDAALAMRLYRDVCAQLQTESLWLRMPDFQGPLNTAGLVVNQENLLVAMYTEPEKAHAFLARVTAFLIRYARYFHAQAQGRVCGYVWPYTFFPCEIGLALTEDMMPLLSADLYALFGIPCLQALAREFGGLQIHCCGDWGRHAVPLSQSGINIMAAEFHYPFTDIRELDCLAERTVFIPRIVLEKQNVFASETDYYESLLATTDPRHRFWFAFSDVTEEALDFAGRHGF